MDKLPPPFIVMGVFAVVPQLAITELGSRAGLYSVDITHLNRSSARSPASPHTAAGTIASGSRSAPGTNRAGFRWLCHPPRGKARCRPTAGGDRP